jgi:hypothetical protein
MLRKERKSEALIMQKAFTIKQPEEVAEVQEIREKLKKLE